MRKNALTSIATVLALTGLVSLGASELLHRVAFENAGNLISQLPADYTWQQELAKNWRTAITTTFHPLGLILFVTPVAAFAAWRQSPRLAWVIFTCIVLLFVFDIYVLVKSIADPNSDRKGCEVCVAAVLPRVPIAAVSFILAVGGAMKWISRHLHA